MAKRTKQPTEFGATMARLRKAAAAIRQSTTLQAALTAAGMPADLVSIREAGTIAGVADKAIRWRIREWGVTTYGTSQAVRVSLSAVCPAISPRQKSQARRTAALTNIVKAHHKLYLSRTDPALASLMDGEKAWGTVRGRPWGCIL